LKFDRSMYKTTAQYSQLRCNIFRY
jgi:hypothetical protein